IYTMSLHDALPISCKLTDKTGDVVAVKAVTGEEELMLITVAGVLIRIPVTDISETGRNTMGVRLIRLQNDEEVATVAKVEHEEDEQKGQEEASQSDSEVNKDEENRPDEE